MMTPTPAQPGSSPVAPEATAESQPDGQCPPLLTRAEILAEIKYVQTKRLSHEHLCRMAVERGDLRAARQHARGATELDGAHRALNQLIYASEAREAAGQSDGA